MTFRPELLRYKGRRCAGAHSHTLLSYRGTQIVFTAEGGLLTVSITGRFTQRSPHGRFWIILDSIQSSQ